MPGPYDVMPDRSMPPKDDNPLTAFCYL